MSWPLYTPNNDGNMNFICPAGPASGTETSFALDAAVAYVYATSGKAIALFSFIAPETANLTDIWFKVKTYTGTWASTDGNINWEIREGLNGTRIPGTTLTASGTFALDGTTGWKNITGLTAGLTAGKFYVLILYDADGGATNNVTITTRYGNAAGTAQKLDIGNEVGTTTNGFLTAYSTTGGAPAACIKVGTRYFCGQIQDSVATITSGTYERGNRFKAPENCTFAGWGCGPNEGNLTLGTDAHVFKLYADATAPGGTPLVSFTKPSVTINSGTSPVGAAIVLPEASWVNLTKDTWYRVVIDPAAALTQPRKAAANGSPDSTLLAAGMPFGGNFYRTEESGGTWSDTTTETLSIGPILIPNADSAGGGSRSVVI